MQMPDNYPNDRVFNVNYSANTVPQIQQMRSQLQGKNLKAFDADVKRTLGSRDFSPSQFLKKLDSWDISTLQPKQLEKLQRCYVAMNQALKIWEENEGQIRREKSVPDPMVEKEIYDEAEGIKKCLSVAIQSQELIQKV